MKQSPPSGEFFCPKMPTRYARCHFGAEKWWICLVFESIIR